MAKDIQVNLKLDTTQAVTSADNFADAIDTSVRSLDNLESQAETLRKKLGTLDPKTAEWKKYAKELSSVKSEIVNLELSFETLDLEQKITAGTDALGGLAGGFAATQGAIALAGIESENFEKQMLKVQGSMALAMGIKDIGTAVAAMKKLNVTTKIATAVQKAFNFVMNMNPITLIVTAIGLLVAGFVAFSDKVRNVVLPVIQPLLDAFSFIGDGVDWVVGKFNDLIGASDALADSLGEVGKKSGEALVGVVEDALKAEEEVTKAQKAANKEREAENKRRWELKLKQDKEAADKALKAEQARLKAEQELTMSSIEAAELRVAEQLAKDEERRLADLETDRAFKELQVQNIIDRDAKAEALRQQELEREQAIEDAKMSIQNSVAKGATALTDLLVKDAKKADKIQRAVALAQIGIDTAKAISALVAASSANPANAVTGGAAGFAQYAAGIAQILGNMAQAAKLLKAPAPNVGGAASGGASSASASFGVPINSVNSGSTLIGNGNNDKETFKVIVTETDITNTQNQVNQIMETATVV